MNTQELLNDYDHFASYFMSLSPSEDSPSEPADLDDILASLEEAE